MTIKMLGTMACNPQETAKVAAQLLPFYWRRLYVGLFADLHPPSPDTQYKHRGIRSKI